MTSALFSAIHLYSVALAVAVFFMRFYHLGKTLDEQRIKKVFFWDNLSLLVVFLLMGTGFWRLLGELEKPLDFYLQSTAFWWKMGLLTLGWMIEMPVMITLIKWRVKVQRGVQPNTAEIHRFRKFEIVEGVCFPIIIVAASLMARGYGQPVMDTSNLPSVRIEGKVADVLEGEKIYSQYCQSCHQPDGRGLKGKLAGDFVGQPERLWKSDENLLKVIRDGIPGTAMVAWKSKLSKAERRNVLAYIRSQWGLSPP